MSSDKKEVLGPIEGRNQVQSQFAGEKPLQKGPVGL